MTDQSQGPGWWLASDGKWYPPDQAPAVPPPDTWTTPPPQPPPPGGLSGGAKAALIVGASIVALVLVIGIAALFLGSESSSTFSATGSAITPEDGPSPGGGDDEALPDGYALVEGDGVSIGTPEEWQEIAPEDFDLSPEEVDELFPDMPEGIADQFGTLFQQGAVLVAFEPSPTGGSNVNIIEAPGEVPLDDLEGEVEAQLGTFGAELVEAGRVTLPAGEAYRVEYTFDVNDPSGEAVAGTGVQYYLPADGHTYIITVSGPSGAAEVADLMAETFRVD